MHFMRTNEITDRVRINSVQYSEKVILTIPKKILIKKLKDVFAFI
jgi:hypothetical protein